MSDKKKQVQRIVVYGMISVLAAFLIGVLVYSQLAARVAIPRIEEKVSVSGLTSEEAQKGFDTAVLQGDGYKFFDKQPVTDGRLPIAPPATRGKTNLFER